MNTNNDQRPDLLGSVTGYTPQPWSEDRPKAVGWWWAERISGDRKVLRVKEETINVKTRLWVAVAEYDHWPADSERFNGWRWAGPLPEPLDAPDAEPGYIDTKLSDCGAKRSRSLHRIVRRRGLSVVITDELSNESIRVEINEIGVASITGRGDLLNWFCDQLPHFRGLFGGESLPEGRDLYVRVRDADNKPNASPRLYRPSLAAPADGEVWNG